MKRVTINIGFITNSSSVVYWIPRQVLEDADVSAFISKYELQDGYIGNDLWYRSSCGSFATTKQQRDRINHELTRNEYPFRADEDPLFDADEDNVVAVFGDEYNDISMELAHLLRRAAERMGLPVGRIDYN